MAGFEAGEGGLALIQRFDRTSEYLGAIDDRRERALAYFAAVNIPFSRQYEFNVALDQLFETDDATRLMAFVADCA
ncbi:hypothetical protein [Frondihabitans sp. PAMC 28766]|uniref:hypothetical protein n=1 Tax=Frondihabitans sp. PAMC 28766 TaxID=1795630 RepID=UPI0012FF63E5|nr:hypothetical protein [Frondihabitans sp. PAMC 28766]